MTVRLLTVNGLPEPGSLAQRLAAAGSSLAAAGSSLAAVAAEAGYADHAHLVRECRRLSGRSPSDLFKTASERPA